MVAAARDVKETQLLLGFRTPAINHADVPALDLLAVALGQGDSSRLNLEVVRNRQLVTNTSAYLFSARDPGLMVVAASLPPGRVDEAARAMLDEILRLSREEMPQEELAKARTILESDRVYDKETVQGHARKLGFFAAIAGDVGFEDRYLAGLQKLTPADLRRVAAQYLRVSNLTVFAQVPEPKTDKQKARTEKIAASIKKLAEAAEARADARFARATAAGEGDHVVTHVFPSGLKLLVLRDASVPIVAVRATWVGGLRYEDERSNGISHMLASSVLARHQDPKRRANHERGRGHGGQHLGLLGPQQSGPAGRVPLALSRARLRSGGGLPAQRHLLRRGVGQGEANRHRRHPRAGGQPGSGGVPAFPFGHVEEAPLSPRSSRYARTPSRVSPGASCCNTFVASTRSRT